MKLSKVLSILFVLTGLVTLFACSSTLMASDAYVTIDINPSIELVVSPKEKVIYANALNEDAEILLSEVNVIGMDLKDAIDLIIEKAIELGFIDVAEEGVEISVSTIALGAAIRQRIHQMIKDRINQAFEKRGMLGRAIDKEFVEEFLLEAEALGVAPGILMMAKSILILSDEYVLEDLLAMEADELMDILKSYREENHQIVMQLRENFIAERDLIRQKYQPQIQALEAQLEEEGADTEAILAEIEVLKAELREEVTRLRESYLQQAQLIREQVQSIAQNKRVMHQHVVEAFRNQMQQRREAMIERIKEYQGRRP